MTTLTRENLYEELWNSPMTEVAKKYGLSDVGLKKIAVKLGVPVPPRGYWAKAQNGKKPPQQPLRAWKGETTYQLSSIHAAKAALPEEKLELPAIEEAKIYEKAPDNQIDVPTSLFAPHPIISATRKAVSEHKPYRSVPVWKAGGKGMVSVEVSKPILERTLILADAFLKAAEKRGYEFSWSSENKSSHRDVLYLTLTKEKTSYRIRLRQKPGTLIIEPNSYSSSTKKNAPPPIVPTPVLQLELSDYIFGYGAKTYQDTPTKPLEKQLNTAFLWMATYPIRKAIEAAAREEESRKRQNAYELKVRPFRIRDAELKRLEECEKDAVQFARAEKLRAYADAMEKQIRISNLGKPVSSQALEPVTWIRARANWLDPLIGERWPEVDDLEGIREPSFWEC